MHACMQYKIDYQNYAFYKQNLELGFNGKYLDEETIWKEYLSENANFFEVYIDDERKTIYN